MLNQHQWSGTGNVNRGIGIRPSAPTYGTLVPQRSSHTNGTCRVASILPSYTEDGAKYHCTEDW
jgi:hypothetical protein